MSYQSFVEDCVLDLQVQHVELDFPATKPEVLITFDNGQVLRISTKEGVFFKGLLSNRLRKAKPISSVEITHKRGSWAVTFHAFTFPQIVFLADNKQLPKSEFPFELEWVTPR